MARKTDTVTDETSEAATAEAPETQEVEAAVELFDELPPAIRRRKHEYDKDIERVTPALIANPGKWATLRSFTEDTEGAAQATKMANRVAKAAGNEKYELASRGHRTLIRLRPAEEV